MPIQPIYLKNGPNGLNWQCCLAGSSKTAPRILIFSITIGADYSYEMKNSEIWAPAFFKHNNSFIATVYYIDCNKFLLILLKLRMLERIRFHSILDSKVYVGYLEYD